MQIRPIVAAATVAGVAAAVVLATAAPTEAAPVCVSPEFTGTDGYTHVWQPTGQLLDVPGCAPRAAGEQAQAAPRPQQQPAYRAPARRQSSSYQWCGAGTWWERSATGGTRPGYAGHWRIVRRWGCETHYR